MKRRSRSSLSFLSSPAPRRAHACAPRVRSRRECTSPDYPRVLSAPGSCFAAGWRAAANGRTTHGSRRYCCIRDAIGRGSVSAVIVVIVVIVIVIAGVAPPSRERGGRPAHRRALSARNVTYHRRRCSRRGRSPRKHTIILSPGVPDLRLLSRGRGYADNVGPRRAKREYVRSQMRLSPPLQRMRHRRSAPLWSLDRSSGSLGIFCCMSMA